MAKLADQLAEALRTFEICDQKPALIGGLAVNAHGVVRATSDLDFLVAATDAERLHEALLDLHYRCIYRTDNVGNYARGSERIDLIYAHRPRALMLLREATSRIFAGGEIAVVGVEGLIGFKLQALQNDPRRLRDADDIRELLRANLPRVDMERVRDYFQLFEQEEWLSQLLEELRTDEDESH